MDELLAGLELEGPAVKPAAEAGLRLGEEALDLLGARQAGAPLMGALEDTLAPGAARDLDLTSAAARVDKPEQIINYKQSGYVDQGDEGIVYSNADGTVSKVFHNPNADANSAAAIFRQIKAMGINTPEVLQVGRTADGRPAMVLQQIGDGDHLQTQLLLGQIPPAEMPALRSQYDQMAKTLNNNGVRIDWQLKNMTWDQGKLYLLDPSFIKNEPLGTALVQRFRP